MELRDLLVTPFLLIAIYAIAFLIRPYATDQWTRPYFIPALTVRIVGALAVGFIYQFYYDGGDTFTYHTHGSRHIFEAFLDSPLKGIQLILSDGTYTPSTFKYASKIWFYGDHTSYFVVRVAAIFDLLTFSSYSGTAVLFSVTGFVGAWLLFLAFYKLYPRIHKWLAFSCLFVPTVFFWGSGIFKDTLTLAALGVATYFVFKMITLRKFSVWSALLIFFCFWILYAIKIYILLCFLPAIILWIFIRNLSKVRSLVLRMMLMPAVLLLVAVIGYYAIQSIAEDDPRYNINKIAVTAQVTAYDIRYWTGKDAGSGYSLGELDGTFGSMIKLTPQAIIVSLFRPYLWEVRNPLMLLSALESLAMLCLTGYVLVKSRGYIFKGLRNPEVAFCLVFALVFAFSVGISTYNFGTLSRYKIPLIPFYLMGIGLIYHLSRRPALPVEKN